MKFARALFAFAVLVSFIRVASADDRGKARAAFRAGSQHYNLGEFQQALDGFREAYRNYDDPSFLFNIAQCERQLGHKREAVREYRAYLNNAGDNADNRDEINKIIAQLEKEIADEQSTAKMPPTSVTPPPPATTPTSATTTLTASAPPPAERTPAYKKWWVWTIVGGVAVAGAAAGLAVGLTHNGAPSASTTLGTRSPF